MKLAGFSLLGSLVTGALLTSLTAQASISPGYCVALRGNGELEPAHWGALASTVEQLGLPKAMAGGSSATISMFFLDSMATHPLIRKSSLEEQKQNASLMLKSLHGFFHQLQKTEAWDDVKALYGHYKTAQSLDVLSQVKASLDKGLFADAIATLKKAVELGLLDVSAVQKLVHALQSGNTQQAKFFVQQFQESIQVFGKFNAESDSNLFFRPGVVSFEKAASTFGKVAGFYAAAGDTADNLRNWEQFFKSCAPQSKGLNWTQIIAKNPACNELFGKIFQTHYQNDKSKIEQNMIGMTIPMLPTTAVLTGSAAKEFRLARDKYYQSMDPKFGDQFRLSQPEDVKFGYWGDLKTLNTIAQRLNPNDEKSRRFLALGITTWQDVLSLSPAEPGLAPLKDFMTFDGRAYVSAGGWSDLHPVAVLKAAGCDEVVYITRRGGESLFAQGIAKRLLNLDRDWKHLKSGDTAATQLNESGDRSDLNSGWSRLYNLANPQSSVNQSLSQASLILCTNWNDFDIMKNFIPLIEDSYRSPFWKNPSLQSSFTSNVGPVLKEKRPGCGI